MPINPASIRRPVSPVAKTYTPPNGMKYKVKDGDSWVSLAASRGISAWDLVRYNYPGLPTDVRVAATEVNWYLQEYVGCTKLTPNQRNYAFSSSATPGEVWLPNPAAAAPVTPDEAARNLVLATLRDPVVQRMNFGVGRIFIRAKDYENVAKAIEGGFIKVKMNPSLGHIAMYYWANPDNRIEVSPTTGAALIIHECTHAIFDVRMIATHVDETEGMAYVAQALYGLLKNGPTARYIVSSDPLHPISWASWQFIFDESTRLATTLLNTHRVTDDDAALLHWAIKHANIYQSRADSDQAEVNDGVGDAFYNSL